MQPLDGDSLVSGAESYVLLQCNDVVFELFSEEYGKMKNKTKGYLVLGATFTGLLGFMVIDAGFVVVAKALASAFILIALISIGVTLVFKDES